LVNIHNCPEHLNFQLKISSPNSQMTIFWARWNQSMHFFTTYQTTIYIQDCFSQPPRSLQVPDLSQKLRSRKTLLMHMFAASPMQDKHLLQPITAWLKTAELLLHHSELYKVIIAPCKLHVPLIPLCDLIYETPHYVILSNPKTHHHRR
jgi:hypothetical protein